MRTAKLWVLMGLPFVLVACGGEEGGEEASEADTVATVDSAAPAGGMAMDTAGAAAGMASTVALSPLNNSGISGEANVSEQAGQTQVMVRLTGSQPNAVHKGHIHSGTCENLGGVVAPLQDVTIGADGSGTSTSTVSQPMMNLANGQHVVNYHLPDGKPAACGVIQHSM